jgi:hypothetical protein
VCLCSTDNAIKNRWNSTLKRLLTLSKERILSMQEEQGYEAVVTLLGLCRRRCFRRAADVPLTQMVR